MPKISSTYQENRQRLTTNCPLTCTIELIGGRWKLHILCHLSQQPKRFGELKESLAGISDKMLAQQLRELQQTGLLVRYSVPKVIPAGTEYALTSLSRSLLPILEQLRSWGESHQIAERLIARPAEQR